MMRSRRLSYAAALAALAAMAFAQAAFALAACDPARAAARAPMIVAQDAQYATCHEPADNANLCLAHCQGRESTLDKHQVKVPDLSLNAVLTVRPRQEAHRPARWAPGMPSPATGPPPRILFRPLLI